MTERSKIVAALRMTKKSIEEVDAVKWKELFEKGYAEGLAWIERSSGDWRLIRNSIGRVGDRVCFIHEGAFNKEAPEPFKNGFAAAIDEIITEVSATPSPSAAKSEE